MKLTYQIVLGIDGQEAGFILCHQKGFIPKVPANTDYQEYLEWLAEGNTPEEAE